MRGQTTRAAAPRPPGRPGPVPRLEDPRPVSGQLEASVLARMDAARGRLGLSRCDFLRLAVDEKLAALDAEGEG